MWCWLSVCLCLSCYYYKEPHIFRANLLDICPGEEDVTDIIKGNYMKLMVWTSWSQPHVTVMNISPVKHHGGNARLWGDFEALLMGSWMLLSQERIIHSYSMPPHSPPQMVHWVIVYTVKARSLQYHSSFKVPANGGIPRKLHLMEDIRISNAELISRLHRECDVCNQNHKIVKTLCIDMVVRIQNLFTVQCSIIQRYPNNHIHY